MEQVFGSMHEALTRMRMSDDSSSRDVRELREAIMKKDDVIKRLQADLEHYQRQGRISGDQVSSCLSSNHLIEKVF